jgi:hypothetical protein
VELVGVTGDGLEEEIDGDQSPGCRAHRRRLGASQLVWLDEKKAELTAELQSIT